MPKIAKRSVLTVDQQNHERSRMMRTTGKIISQIDEYIREGNITVGGKKITVDTTRLSAWRLCLDRTVPTMSSAEITHKSEYDSMDTGKIIERLAQIASKKPELAIQLQEALGGRVINTAAEVVGEAPGDDQLHEAKHESELIPHSKSLQTQL